MSELKVLSFLGTGPPRGNYSKTIYVKHDDPKQFCETDLFPEAIYKLYNPDKIVVFVTPEVQEGEHLRNLRCRLPSEILKEVKLPSLLDRGNSETDMWGIFDTYQKSVKKGEKIILDITHGFRSLPMLAFPVVAYLRQVKKVVLEHILYAPFDARPESKGKNTQIFDLTPFVDLLNWMNAVNVFQHSGDARQLAKLCESSTIENFTPISETLTNLSDALLMNLPLEAQKAAFTFNNLNLEQQKPSQAPFGILIGELKKTYKGMGIEKPDENPKDSLNAQYKQIEWYIENLHYFQATTLIREWLVSWECQRAVPIQQLLLYNPDWLNENRRDNANKRLNEYTKNYFRQLAKNLAEHNLHASCEEFRRDCKCVRNERDEKFIEIDLHLTSTKLWEDCKIIRNSLAHCGMIKRSPRHEATQIFKEISEKVKRLSDEIKHLQEIYQCFVSLLTSKGPQEIWKARYNQIKWYVDNKHYLHAITLIREWLIFWECFRDPTLPEERDKARNRLNKRSKDKISGKLWSTCLEIEDELSNLESNFQCENAKQTIEKIKSFSGEDGLSKLIN